MSDLSIITLGRFHVTLNGEPAPGFESNKVRALLVYLAVESRCAHTRDQLIGLLWPDQPERAARRALSQALYNLRQTIHDADAAPPFLHITRRTVQLNAQSDVWLDTAEFQSSLEPYQEMRGASPARIESLASAIRLYQGMFLEGLLIGDSYPFSEWASMQRERLHRLALDALAKLTHHYERHREYERARRYARRQVELEPWREEAHRQLMRVLARSGRRSSALMQYQRCCQVLAKELHVKPQRETIALYERIRKAGAPRRHNLPARLTEMLGREAELNKIAARLDDPACRLITLVGPGGIGKTRLALQAAYEALDLFLNGVYFVPLAAVQTEDLLAPTVANALGLQFHGTREPLEQLIDYLCERELLLVLDGFEHLLKRAGWVTALLKAAPHVKTLVTSRERLNLRAEWLLDIRGLAYPGDDEATASTRYAAVQLFQKRAMQVRADFTLDAQTTSPVSRICRLLAGLPLGIELAAALIRVCSPKHIAREMERDLDLLTTSLRDVPQRHQSLRAVFEHSWRLLLDTEQAVLAKLSVFQGPFSEKAARAIADATPGILSKLVEKSLFRQTPAGHYDLHALVRQYATEKLAASEEQQDTVQQLHGCYYADFLHGHTTALKGRRQTEAQAEIGEALGDIKAAWRRAIENERSDILNRSLESLHLFYQTQGRYREGRDLFALAADGVPRGSILRARLWARQADFCSWLSDYETAQTLAERSLTGLESSGRSQDLGFVLEVMGRVAYYVGAYDEAQTHLQGSIDKFRQVGDLWGLAQALNYLGHVMCGVHEDYGEALPCYEESLVLSRQLGNQAGTARALINLGAIERNLKRYEQAERFYEEAMAISRETGHRRHLAIALGNLGDVACTYGDYKRATTFLEDSLSLKRELGNRFSLIYTLSHLGRVAAMTGQTREAKRWYDEALQTAYDIGATGHVADVLVSVARLLAIVDERASAVELVQVALDHTCGDQEVTQAANEILAELESELSPQIIAAHRARGKKKTLETTVAEILERSIAAM